MIDAYKNELIEAGIPSDYLVVDQILARHNDAYLVKWKDQPYDSSTFESVYYLLPAGADAILRFVLE